MKRCAFALVLSLLLLAGFALADSPFYTVTEMQGDVVTGETTAVATDPNTLLCASLLPHADGSTYTITDGSGQTADAFLSEDRAGLMVFTTEADVGSGYRVVSMELGSVYVFHEDTYFDGVITGAVTWRGNTCGLMTAPGAVRGDVVADASGYIMGFVAAVWTEGVDQYVVIPAELPAEPTVTDLSLQTENGVLRISWRNAEEGAQPVVTVADLGNNYYLHWMPAAGSETASLVYVPGRVYTVCVSTNTDDPTGEDAAYTTLVTDAAAPVTEHSFTSRQYLGFMPAGTDQYDATQRVPEGQNVTADALTGTDPLFLQVINTYDVTEQIDLAMAIALTAPDGCVFWQEATYSYLPNLTAEDAWMADLSQQMSDLIKYHDGTVPSGEYTVAYYIGGQLGGSVTFVLE